MKHLPRSPWMQWPETEALVRAFDEGAVALRFVGGCVRDSLLGREVQDIDAATPAKPDAVTKLLQRANIRAIPTGIEHGTVTALIEKKHFEITTLRRDVNCDGRHAEVEYTDDWREDALRRDFTINALYATPAGEIVDYVGGLAHLNPVQIIFIGNAEARIEEDALRILRFFRFSAQLGAKEYDAAALSACAKNLRRLELLSGERIAQEMLKLLGAEALDLALFTHMQKAGIPKAIGLPAPPEALIHPPLASDALARLALWLGDADAKALAKRWKLSRGQLRMLQDLMQTAAQLQKMPAVPALKKILRAIDRDLFSRSLRMAWAMQPTEERYYSQALTLAEQWPIPQFPVTGEDLLKRGYKEGRALGAKLKALEAIWEAEDYIPTREDLLKRL